MAQVDDSGELQNAWVTLSSVPFQLDWREEGGPDKTAYSFDEPENTVYAFFNEEDSRVVFELTYVIEDAVQAYSDVGELYWQFVGSSMARRQLGHFPYRYFARAFWHNGRSGRNVRAWGHGPLDATVQINSDGTVSYSVPHISAGSYAEARILFQPNGSQVFLRVMKRILLYSALVYVWMKSVPG